VAAVKGIDYRNIAAVKKVEGHLGPGVDRTRLSAVGYRLSAIRTAAYRRDR
jgi:hypothetical protein